jgi:Cytidylate kinase-like family
VGYPYGEMTLVALSAAYGAAGSQIGPGLAEQLGVPFIDRGIALAVAERLNIPVADALAHEETRGPSLLERVLSGFLGADPGAPAPLLTDVVTPDDFHRASQEALLAQAATGRGVILGRAGAVVLADDPRALHVRLDGPVARRIVQAMRLEDVSRETAEHRQRETDRAREAYVRRYYQCNPTNCELYDLVLDSTRLPLATCVDLIATASAALQRELADRGA